MRSTVVYFLGLSSLILTTIYSAAVGVDSVTQTSFGEYLALLIFSSYCIFVIISEYQKGEIASPLSLFMAAALLHFGISGIWYNDRSFFVSYESREYYISPIIFILLFLICFHVVYRAVIAARWRAYERPGYYQSPDEGWRSTNVLIVLLVLLVAGWTARILVIQAGIYLQVTTGLEEHGQIPFIGTIRLAERFPDYATWISWAFFFAVHNQKKGTRTERFWLIISVGLLLVTIVYWLPTGKKKALIETFCVPALIGYLTTRTMPPLKYMAIAAISLVLIFPLSHMYRVVQQEYLRGRLANVTVGDLVDAIYVAATRIDVEDERTFGAQGRTFGRLNVIEPVSGAMRLIDDGSTELRLGIDYANFFVNMIPGFLWKDKPPVHYGNEFGRAINQVQPLDMNTNISITLPGEAYLNFGWLGMLVGGLIAIIYGGIYKWAGGLRCRSSGRILYAICVPTILYIGASFALYMSALLQSILLIYILCKIMEFRVVKIKSKNRIRKMVPGGS